MKTLVYESPITSLSGYGEHSREIAEYLVRLNEQFDLFYIDTPWGNTQSSTESCSPRIKQALKNKPNTESCIDIFIQVGMLHELKKVGKFNIGISSVVEVSLCTKDSIDKCNLMDLVIVPSSFCKTVIESSAKKYGIPLTTPIEIIPQCVDHIKDDQINSDNSLKESLDDINEEFCFLSIGEWNLNVNPTQDRKNIEYLIRTFISTFDNQQVEKPALILKTHITNYSQTDYDRVYDKIKKICRDYDNPPSIYLIHGNLNKRQMVDLNFHEKVKCHIYAPRGEGYGRSILQSTLTGKPTFTSNWSGPTDYIQNSDFLISGKLTEVGSNTNLFPIGSQWFEISTLDFSKKLKDVLENYDLYCDKMKIITNENAEKYKFEEIFKKYKDIINSYISF